MDVFGIKWFCEYTYGIARGDNHMSFIKRIIVILTLIIVSMLIIPVITINTVKADAGISVALLLFFVVNPAASVCVGIISGRDFKRFWFTPILIAVLFWVFSSITYQTAFPIVYSIIYFVLSCISMLATWIIVRKK